MRAVALAALVLAAVPAPAGAATAVVRSDAAGEASVSGVGCGVAATATVPLPATATAIAVRRPRVGETTDEWRLTGVAASGTSVVVTAVGDGPTVCDPEEDPDVPPAQRPWQGAYRYDIAFRERVAVKHWAGAAVRRARPATRAAAATSARPSTTGASASTPRAPTAT